jgi:hypothetical protein
MDRNSTLTVGLPGRKQPVYLVSAMDQCHCQFSDFYLSPLPSQLDTVFFFSTKGNLPFTIKKSHISEKEITTAIMACLFCPVQFINFHRGKNGGLSWFDSPSGITWKN